MMGRVTAVVALCVSSAHLLAQPDPTPVNPFVCAGVFVPPATPYPQRIVPLNEIPSQPYCAPTDLYNHAGGLPLDDYGATWVNGAWTKDRRPAVFIQMFNGSWADNVRGHSDFWWHGQKGLSAEWCEGGNIPLSRQRDNESLGLDQTVISCGTTNGVPDDLEHTIADMERMYKEGFRRFILNVPGGVAFEQDLGMNQWATLTPVQRGWFENPLGPWQKFRERHQSTDPREKLSLEIYVGCNIQAGTCATCERPNSLYNTGLESIVVERDIGGGQFVNFYATCCSHFEKAIDFNPRVNQHLCHVYDVILPWRNIGINRFWMDAASDNFNALGRRKLYGFLEMSYNPVFRSVLGVTFGGETIPTTDYDGLVPNDCALELAPWLALSQKLMFTPPGGPRQFHPNFYFNPTLTEMHFVPFPAGNEPPINAAEMFQARAHGMVITLYNCLDELHCEAVKRLYTMGDIYIADFNGDGLVTEADYDQYLTMYGEWINVPDAALFATGDIDGSGNVDITDLQQFMEAWNHHASCVGVPEGRCGTPETEPSCWKRFGASRTPW